MSDKMIATNFVKFINFSSFVANMVENKTSPFFGSSKEAMWKANSFNKLIILGI